MSVPRNCAAPNAFRTHTHTSPCRPRSPLLPPQPLAAPAAPAAAGAPDSAAPTRFSPPSGECLGAEMLLGLLKNYARSRNLKTAVTVGIVGASPSRRHSLLVAEVCFRSP